VGSIFEPLIQLLRDLERTQWERRAWPILQGKILTRFDLQEMKLPPGDYSVRTSGATGVPVEVSKTNLSKLWYAATNLREAIWHKRDVSLPFAVIRPQIEKEIKQNEWGPAFSLLGKTGPLYGHPVQGDLNGWLQKIQPSYLMTYPSILETSDKAKGG
jgi:hypothetical protein